VKINHTYLALLFALVGGATQLGVGTTKTRLLLQQPTGNKGGEEERTKHFFTTALIFSHQRSCNEVRVDKTVLVRGTPNILLMQKPSTQPPNGPSFFQDWSGSTAQQRCLGPAGSPIAFI